MLNFTTHRSRREAEVGIDRLEQFAELDDFGADLIFGAEDVTIVLNEAAHTHDAMQRAATFVAHAGAELGHTQRQVAVALQSLLEDLDMAGAVHRLDREAAVDHRLVDLAIALALRFASFRAIDAAVLLVGDEHVLAILGPVTRSLPQLLRLHDRGADLDVAGALDTLANVVLDRAIDRPALGVPVDLTWVVVLQMEQIHLLADLAVVALFGSSSIWRCCLRPFLSAKQVP